MRMPDHHTCLLQNLYARQEATENGHGPTDWFKTGRGVCQGCILSPCLFSLYAEHVMRSNRLMKNNLESRLPGEMINNLRHTDNTILWQKAKRN